MRKILTLTCFACFSLAGALELSVSEWNLGLYETASGSYDNQGLISITDGGSDYWNVQLTHTGIALEYGHSYQVIFTVQSLLTNRAIEVRIGRNGFPYDAFAEFGALNISATEKTVTKKFTMGAATTDDARFEFNVGKYTGHILISDVSVTCLDCDESTNTSGSGTIVEFNAKRLLSAETVTLSDYTKTLGGSIYGGVLELGADTKIYGDVEVGTSCFLRERATISGTLASSAKCTEQNSVSKGAEVIKSIFYTPVTVNAITVGTQNISVNLDAVETIAPNTYGSLYINARSKVTFSSGKYVFANVYTEPDAQLIFDVTDGPIEFSVRDGIRFADRNVSIITGGNPSEISWVVGSGSIDFGTDGKFFGRFIAPNSSFRIASRTSLVGGVVAKSFLMEPQSSLSMEPLAEEISHSEFNFGPFYNAGIFRYTSVIPTSVSALEMYVYADGYNVLVNGSNSRSVSLSASSQDVTIKLSRNIVEGFPSEAFSSTYVFNFEKNVKNRIYWNPQSSCATNCDGGTAATALSDFAEVKTLAEITGKEIVMTGGIWTVANNYTDGVVPWNVGFELIGSEQDIWNLSSVDDLPLIQLGSTSHIQIFGESPRALSGLRIFNGFNEKNGGAIFATVDKLNISNVIISGSVAQGNGGGVYLEDSLIMQNVRMAGNVAGGKGGALYSTGLVQTNNGIFVQNASVLGGGATVVGKSSYFKNSIFYLNTSDAEGGAIENISTALEIWNCLFYGNTSKLGYAGISGSINGLIVNTIFWKNMSTGCLTDGCTQEVVDGFTAQNSSFSSSYTGSNIYVGDPVFLNESDPTGGVDFMGYNAGLNLAETSPLVAFGAMIEGVPVLDILGGERNDSSIPLGPYAWTLVSGDVVFGQLQTDNRVKLLLPALPLVNRFPDEWFVNYMAKSKMARTIKTTIRKHDKTKISKAKVRISLKNAAGDRYSDVPSIDIYFYRNGEENGRYVFQSMTQDKGKPILFSKRIEDQGEYDNATIICVKATTDILHFKIIDP